MHAWLCQILTHWLKPFPSSCALPSDMYAYCPCGCANFNKIAETQWEVGSSYLMMYLSDHVIVVNFNILAETVHEQFCANTVFWCTASQCSALVCDVEKHGIFFLLSDQHSLYWFQLHGLMTTVRSRDQTVSSQWMVFWMSEIDVVCV